MKKIILISLLAGILLFSCGKGDKSGKIVLNYLDSFADVDLMGKVLHDQIKKYDKENPNIKIKIEHVQWDRMNQKVMTAIAAESPHDVVLLDRFVTASYAAKNALIPLGKYVKETGLKEKDFWECCWKECIYNNKMWAIPHHTDIRVLYYNTEHFKEAGLDPEKPPKTWKQLLEYSKKLTKRDEKGRLVQIGFIPGFSQGRWLHIWAWGNNGEFMQGNKITCNSPQIVGALEWMKKLNNWYGRKAVQGAQQGFGRGEFDPFICGKLSMCINGDWNLGNIKQYGPNLKFKIAYPPVPQGKKPVSWSGGYAFVIPKGSKQEEESWKLIKHLTSYNIQLEYATNAFRIPALKKASKNKFFLSHPHYKIFIALMKYSRYRPVTPAAQYYWEQLKMAVENTLLELKTPKQALDDAANDTQKYLDEYLK